MQKTEIVCETYIIDTDGTSSNFAQNSKIVNLWARYLYHIDQDIWGTCRKFYSELYLLSDTLMKVYYPRLIS
jgi:hypothetical protein